MGELVGEETEQMLHASMRFAEDERDEWKERALAAEAERDRYREALEKIERGPDPAVIGDEYIDGYEAASWVARVALQPEDTP